ncbi:hypothetical protein [Ralstonia sp. 24A2]|uniref:hypothetical protein n=1 Tax=Ralstonia sp. 24A2 TaxID=3447364 RepID=UPI003F6A41E1
MNHHYAPQRIDSACKRLQSRYTGRVPETAGAGFGDPAHDGGQPPLGGIFSSVTPSRAFNHGGPGGETFGSAGSIVPVRQPRCLARHPHLAMNGGPSSITMEATMPKALARPEQDQFSLSIAAGRAAAVHWLENPVMSAATWRDSRFAAHACGMGFTELAERRRAFNEAFAQGIADAIVGVVFVAVEVSHV